MPNNYSALVDALRICSSSNGCSLCGYGRGECDKLEADAANAIEDLANRLYKAYASNSQKPYPEFLSKHFNIPYEEKEKQKMVPKRNIPQYPASQEEILRAMYEHQRTPYSQMHKRTEGKIIIMPEVKKIIHSGPVTIVFWTDDTKTIVRRASHDAYDEYNAFCAALAIKMYGNNSKLKKMIKKATVEK